MENFVLFMNINENLKVWKESCVDESHMLIRIMGIRV